MVISIDYHAAPEFKFPTQRDEGFVAYKLLIEGKMGFRPHRIIMVGDSSGANIAAAIIIKLIEEKLRIPDGLVLFYPG